jgi:hypothetical protein
MKRKPVNNLAMGKVYDDVWPISRLASRSRVIPHFKIGRNPMAYKFFLFNMAESRSIQSLSKEAI